MKMTPWTVVTEDDTDTPFSGTASAHITPDTLSGWLFDGAPALTIADTSVTSDVALDDPWAGSERPPHRPTLSAVDAAPVAEPLSARPIHLVAPEKAHPNPNLNDADTDNTESTSASPKYRASVGQLQERANALAAHASHFRAQIAADRAALVAVSVILDRAGHLPANMVSAATDGVAAALAVAGGEDPDSIARRVRATLMAAVTLTSTGAASVAAGLMSGSAVTASVSGALATSLLRRGAIGPAALAGIAGVGAAPALVGGAVAGLVMGGVWWVGRRWERSREAAELSRFIFELRQSRDNMLVISLAIHVVRHHLDTLKASLSVLGPADVALAQQLTDGALRRIQSADLHAMAIAKIADVDDGLWIAPIEATVPDPTLSLPDGSAFATATEGDRRGRSRSPSPIAVGAAEAAAAAQGRPPPPRSASPTSSAAVWSSTAGSSPVSGNGGGPRPRSRSPPNPEFMPLSASWMVVGTVAGSSADVAVIAPADSNSRVWRS
ncbi:hypothetical protein BC828DRAFT_412099 [Blastocladiella britannica]|nr:hypothetical protein BC828DRAFT_412099 [Blastocladiella britannica]